MDKPKRIVLTGVEINVGDETKFVGKVGYVSPVDLPEHLIGAAVFYRESRYADSYSWETDAIGADVIAVDCATVELGAVLFVNWLTDVELLIAATMGELRSSPIVNLGEREQYRLNRNDWRTFAGFDRIDMGYTKIVINADEWANDRAASVPDLPKPDPWVPGDFD